MKIELLENLIKYKLLTDDTKEVEDNGKKETLYRIQALQDVWTIKNGVKTLVVKKGTKGGYVKSVENLNNICFNLKKLNDLDEMCGSWIFDGAMAYGNSVVRDNAQLRGCVQICDNVVVCKDAVVIGKGRLSGNQLVEDNLVLEDEAE